MVNVVYNCMSDLHDLFYVWPFRASVEEMKASMSRDTMKVDLVTNEENPFTQPVAPAAPKVVTQP